MSGDGKSLLNEHSVKIEPLAEQGEGKKTNEIIIENKIATL